MTSAEMFWQQLLDARIIDEEGVHHELAGGLAGGRHGPKADFDLIPDDPKDLLYPLYKNWVDITERKLWQMLQGKFLGRVVLIGVANGTNRLATSVEQSIGRGVTALQTEKNDQNVVTLTDETAKYIQGRRLGTAIFLEDVLKSGGNVAPPLLETRGLWLPHDLAEENPDIRVLATLKRREKAERLDPIDAPYDSIIDHPMPDYPHDDCYYCDQKWVLIPKTKN